MTTVEFETTISAGERPQSFALYHVASGTGLLHNPDKIYKLAIVPNKGIINAKYSLNFPIKTRKVSQG